MPNIKFSSDSHSKSKSKSSTGSSVQSKYLSNSPVFNSPDTSVPDISSFKLKASYAAPLNHSVGSVHIRASTSLPIAPKPSFFTSPPDTPRPGTILSAASPPLTSKSTSSVPESNTTHDSPTLPKKKNIFSFNRKSKEKLPSPPKNPKNIIESATKALASEESSWLTQNERDKALAELACYPPPPLNHCLSSLIYKTPGLLTLLQLLNPKFHVWI